MFLSGCSLFLSETKTPEITRLPDGFSAFASTEIEIPDIEYTEGAVLSVTVNGPSGAVVEVIDGKFTPTVVGDYIITYKVTISGEEVEKSITVKVVASDVLPIINLKKENVDKVLLGEKVTLATATAQDSLGQSLDVTIKVLSPSNVEQIVTEGSFIAEEKGDYTVEYIACDILNNVATVSNTITCYSLPTPVCPVPEDVKNSFETEAECALDKLSESIFSRNSTDEKAAGVKSGAYSLKVNTSGGGTVSLVSQAINGTQDLSDIGTLTFWVYNGGESEVQFNLYKVILVDETSITPNTVLRIPAGEWKQHTFDFTTCGLTEQQLEKVWAIQFWTNAAAELYVDDLAWDNRADYVTIGDVAANLEANYGEEFTIPVPEVSSDATLTITVTDPEGNAVTYSDDYKFTLEKSGEYTIKYSATNGKKTAEKTTVLTVVRPDPTPVGPVPEDVKNSFETEAECALDKLSATTFSRNSTFEKAAGVKSGAYSLKVKTSASATISFVSQAINGTQDLSNIGTLTFWVYNGGESEVQFNIYKVILVDGTAITPNTVLRIPAGEWKQHTFNFMTCGLTEQQLEKVWAIQFWTNAAAELYVDDLAWDNRADYVTIGDIQEEIDAFVGDQIEIETPVVSENAQLVVSVSDPDGVTVSVADGKFTVDKVGNYVISYTAKGENKELSKETIVVVTEEEQEVIPDNVKSFEDVSEITTSSVKESGSTGATISLNTDKQYSRSGKNSVKIEVGSSGPLVDFYMKGILGAEDLSKYSAVKFYVYCESAKSFNIYKTICASGTAITYTQNNTLTAGQWTEITIDLTDAAFAENQKVWSFRCWMNGGDYTYYIDDFTFVEKVEVIPDNVKSFEDVSEITTSNVKESGSTGATISLNTDKQYSRSGNNSVKIEVGSNGPMVDFYMKGIFGTEDLSKYSAVKFYVYCESAKSFNIYSTICSGGTAAISYSKNNTLTAGQWTEITIDLTDVAFAENQSVWSFRCWMNGGAYTYYIDDFTFVEKAE